MVPAAVSRLHAAAPDGSRSVRGEGGRFLFRGHRPYSPGDDIRRIDWRVAARHGDLRVRQFDPERDVLTEVWLDGSASMTPFGGRVTAARATALLCAIALGGGGRVRLGVLRDGVAHRSIEATDSAQVREVLVRLSAHVAGGRADLAQALPRLQRLVPRGSRFLLVSDLLTRADPGVLHPLAGRGLRGALVHMRIPEVNAPAAGGPFRFHDVESGTVKQLLLDEHAAARIAERAKAHADLWAHHGRQIGLRYLPLAPTEAPEHLLRRLVLEVP